MTATPLDAQPSEPPRARPLRDAIELVSSMRFAIALLTLICIASVIGTIIKQHEPANNYVNQFGPFWAPVFEAFGLSSVYSASWFLLILAFLVTSTSLCIARNTPKIIADLKTYKEGVREQSLQAFHHKASGDLAVGRDEAMEQVSELIGSRGWQAKAQVRDNGTMVAARRGGANKLGYLAAHSAIVLVCLGGLFDSDVVVRALMAARGVTPFDGSGLIRDVGAQHRLPETNPTFRGNMLVTEGGRASVAVLNQGDGVVLQELPFEIELKKFHVDFYSTGMPKLFASDVVIHDRDTGQATPATIKVNEPAFHRGVAIYQSSFEDGGSRLKLKGWPLGGGPAFDVDGTVGTSIKLNPGKGEPMTLELTGLRVFNVENMSDASASGADVRKVDLVNSLESHLGSGASTPTRKDLRNIGPSVNYKLRDAAGQAREFHNFMLPVELDGTRVFLAGVKESPAEPFRYLRIPADDKDSTRSWLLMRAALADPAARQRAVERYTRAVTPKDKPELQQQLAASALRGLALYAGEEAGQKDATAPGGLPAISEFLERNVPAEERARASEVLIRILNGSLFELLNDAREGAGLPRLEAGDKTQAFMTHAVLSLSDSYFYPAPLFLQLEEFQQVQASVFQLTRSPGKKLVYLGCILLIVGVFAMLYVRERRLWIWLQDRDGGGTRYTAALSATRHTLDTDREFEAIKHMLAGQHAAPSPENSA